MEFPFNFGPGHFLANLDDEVELEDRHPLVFNARENPWEMRDRKFVKLFRLTKPLARELCASIEPNLPVVRRSSEIPSDVKVLTALRFFSCGSYQDSVGQDKHLALSQSSVSTCITQVLNAMEPLLANYIQFPQDENSMAQIKLRYWQKYRFPGVIGSIDGTHVAIVAPPQFDDEHPEHAYINRKKFHSINTQIISDADNRILSVWAKYPGRVHDSYIWHQSGVRRFLHTQYNQGMRNSWLIGDSGYGLEPVLMKPIANAIHGSPEQRYNRAFRSSRSSVECTIGILKNRWRCLLRDRTLHYYPPVASKIISCCAALHNLCIRENVPLLLNQGEEILNEENIDVCEGVPQYNIAAALHIRNQIVQDYFA